MNSKKLIVYGFIITIVMFLTANLIGSKIHLNSNFIPSSFVGHVTMLLLSVVVIWIMNKGLNFRIGIPKLKKTLKPFFIGVIIAIVINLLMYIITKLTGGTITQHPLLPKLNALQTFLFVFLLASIAEELLFRGFFQNSLKSLNKSGITIFKCKFSFPVIMSAIMFGLAHLILISTGVDFLFLIRIVLFTTILGIASGYYQEKYDNTSYAIIVHMGGNLTAILGALAMGMH